SSHSYPFFFFIFVFPPLFLYILVYKILFLHVNPLIHLMLRLFPAYNFHFSFFPYHIVFVNPLYFLLVSSFVLLLHLSLLYKQCQSPVLTHHTQKISFPSLLLSFLFFLLILV